MDKINNALIYCTVLKNLSIHTIVFKKAFKMAQEFEEKLKYQGENTTEFWQAKAYQDFINLLIEEEKIINKLKTETLNSLVFLIK